MTTKDESTLRRLELEMSKRQASAEIFRDYHNDILAHAKAMRANMVRHNEIEDLVLEFFKGEFDSTSVFTFEETVDIDDVRFLEKWIELEASGKADDYDAWIVLLRQFNILEIFKDKESWPQKNQSGSSKKYYPIALNKLNGFMKNYRQIKGKHPGAKMLAAICRDPNQGDIIHFVAFYRQNLSNVAIVAPIEAKCYSACYVWVNDQPEYTPDDWETIFHYDPTKPCALISKYRVWLRNDTKRFYHVAALKTKGLNEVDNMWSNALEYIDRVA